MKQREHDTIRSYGGAGDALALFRQLHADVRELIVAAGFGQIVEILSPWHGDMPVILALAERWQDSSSTFHLPVGEMTVTPADFAALTGLRVGGDPIPFDDQIFRDQDALEWYLGFVPRIDADMARHTELAAYFTDEPQSAQHAEQMARGFILYMFSTYLLAGRRDLVHLSYLPGLRDLRTASRYDWGGCILGACYAFMGSTSRDKTGLPGSGRSSR